MKSYSESYRCTTYLTSDLRPGNAREGFNISLHDDVQDCRPLPINRRCNGAYRSHPGSSPNTQIRSLTGCMQLIAPDHERDRVRRASLFYYHATNPRDSMPSHKPLPANYRHPARLTGNSMGTTDRALNLQPWGGHAHSIKCIDLEPQRANIQNI